MLLNFEFLKELQHLLTCKALPQVKPKLLSVQNVCPSIHFCQEPAPAKPLIEEPAPAKYVRFLNQFFPIKMAIIVNSD